MYCRSCGTKLDIRKGNCPVCGADQRVRRVSFFLTAVVLLAAAILAAVFVLGTRLEKAQTLTAPAAYTAEEPSKGEIDSANVVYVTHAGTKYHKAGCSYLNDSKERISLQEAQSLGYEPCAFCFGD